MCAHQMSENWKIGLVNWWFGILCLWGGVVLISYINGTAWSGQYRLVVNWGVAILLFLLLVIFISIRPTLINVIRTFLGKYLLLFTLIFLFLWLTNDMWLLLDQKLLKIRYFFSYPLFAIILLVARNVLFRQLSWPWPLTLSKKYTIEDWIGTKTPQSNGVDARKITLLSGSRLKNLEFTVQSSSGYWRAGFKLTKSSQDVMPILDGEGILFHLWKEAGEDFIRSRIYPDGKHTNYIDTKIENSTASSPIKLSTAINEKNFLTILVNSEQVYKNRFDPSLYEKAFLVSWADPNDYTVNFTDINYRAS